MKYGKGLRECRRHATRGGRKDGIVLLLPDLCVGLQQCNVTMGVKRHFILTQEIQTVQARRTLAFSPSPNVHPPMQIT